MFYIFGLFLYFFYISEVLIFIAPKHLVIARANAGVGETTANTNRSLFVGIFLKFLAFPAFFLA